MEKDKDRLDKEMEEKLKKVTKRINAVTGEIFLDTKKLKEIDWATRANFLVAYSNLRQQQSLKNYTRVLIILTIIVAALMIIQIWLINF